MYPLIEGSGSANVGIGIPLRRIDEPPVVPAEVSQPKAFRRSGANSAGHDYLPGAIAGGSIHPTGYGDLRRNRGQPGARNLEHGVAIEVNRAARNPAGPGCVVDEGGGKAIARHVVSYPAGAVVQRQAHKRPAGLRTCHGCWSESEAVARDQKTAHEGTCQRKSGEIRLNKHQAILTNHSRIFVGTPRTLVANLASGDAIFRSPKQAVFEVFPIIRKALPGTVPMPVLLLNSNLDECDSLVIVIRSRPLQ